ncbi:MAG TPA: G8 domain-containing protein [Gemmatimonadales bacterium]|jgi:cell migration-inducing and hyaluronan-binding protein
MRIIPAVVVVAIAAACAQPDAVSSAPPPPPGSPATVLWSDSATWGETGVPVAGANVTIPTGTTVILDVATPPLNRITIMGTLQVATDKDVAITARDIWDEGILRAGSESAHDLHNFTVTLTGADSGVGDPTIGAKVLAVFPGAALELHGDTRLGWTRLSATASAGSTILSLAEPTAWRTGDRLVLASTDYDPGQAEEVVVASATATTITLQTPLHHSHFGLLQTIAGRTVDERGEVGLLTRNVTVQGDSQSSSSFGGHIIVLQGGQAHVEGVTLLRMGQAGHVARYPMHWHMAGDVTGQYIRDASIWKTNNRCITIHGSDNATAERNVCYDHLGHGYFLEDGSETGNLIEHNLGLSSRAPAASLRILPSDATPATFWITNPDNTVRDNDAAGSVAFGFWYALPAAPTGLSTGQPDAPRLTPLRQFLGNEAHSNRQPGLNVDNGPTAALTTETTSYTPRLGAVAAGTPVIATFQNFTGWKNSQRAVWIRGSGLRLDGAVLADNMQGATFANSDVILQNSLVVGESANLTTAPNPSYPIRGFEFYDGTNAVSNVTFANFVSRAGRPASAIGYNRADGFPISPQNNAASVQLVNANAVYLDTPNSGKDGDMASLFVDADGGITGTPGNSIVANTPFLLTPACTLHAEWNSYVCPARYDGLALQTDNGVAVAPLSLRRDDGVTVALAGVPNNPVSAQMSILPSRTYEVVWGTFPPARPRITLQRASVGDWLRVAIPYPGNEFTVLRDYSSTGLSAIGSIAAVDASAGDSYYYDPVTSVVYVKLVVRTGRTSTTIQVVPK